MAPPSRSNGKQNWLWTVKENAVIKTYQISLETRQVGQMEASRRSNQLGLPYSTEAFVEGMVEVFRQVKFVSWVCEKYTQLWK